VQSVLLSFYPSPTQVYALAPRLEPRGVDTCDGLTRVAVTDTLNRDAHILESFPRLPGAFVCQALWGLTVAFGSLGCREPDRRSRDEPKDIDEA
jgi:hypothetical protein